MKTISAIKIEYRECSSPRQSGLDVEARILGFADGWHDPILTTRWIAAASRAAAEKALLSSLRT